MNRLIPGLNKLTKKLSLTSSLFFFRYELSLN